MSDDVEITMHRSATEPKSHFVATIQDTVQESMAYALVRLIAEKIADRYVAEHFAEISAKLDQNAIASLAIADAGKKIAEEIRTKPTLVREPGNRTIVNKYSLF